MPSVFVYHVVGDLTVGKPEVSEFLDTETVESAIKAIAESSEAGIPIWKRRSQKSSQSPANVIENAQSRQQRFVGILNALDIVVFLATTQHDDGKALSTPVSKIVRQNSSALKVVDPATRLIDALEMMKQGAKRLLVPKSLVWRGMSKRFSILYNGKWLKNTDPSNSTNNPTNPNRPSSSSATPTSSIQDKFCCLSREDVLRFLIGCLGALAPLPLSSISSLGAINPNYSYIESSSPAIEAAKKLPLDPCAVAVVETTPNGQHKIIGEISSTKLWKCDYSSAAWALANLTAGQFVMGVEDSMSSTRSAPDDTTIDDMVGECNNVANNGYGSSNRPKIFSSRSIGFLSNSSSSFSRSMYRRRSTPLTCRVTSSLAAVMAQMLSHRATHVWVTEDDDTLVGILGYTEILSAVTRQSVSNVPETTGS